MLNRRSFLARAAYAGAAVAVGVDTAGWRDVGPPRSIGGSPLALVYRGPASSPGIPEDTAAFLQTCSPRFRISYCGPRRGDLAIDTETLAAASVLVQPGGGDDFDAAWEAVRHYAQPLREFVHRGGHYLGICMGGYLAGSGPGFDLLPGNCNDYTGTRGAEVHDARNAVITVDWPPRPRGRRRRIFYQDGPYFWLDRGARARVLARYTNGRIAAMVTPFGSGRVAVCGPHPEANRSWYRLAGLRFPGSTYDLGHELVHALLVG